MVIGHTLGANMGKKKAGSIAANRQKRKARRNPAAEPVARRSARVNPPALHDLTHVVLPGFGAYAASRVAQRIAFTVVGRRWPRLARHTHAAAGLLSFGAAWMLAHRWSRLAKYHDGILVGTGVAALHGLAQAYLPAKYNWLLADCKTSELGTGTGTSSSAPSLEARQVAARNSRMADLTGKPMSSAGDDEFAYLDDEVEDAARAPFQTVSPPKAVRAPVAAALKVADRNDEGDASKFDVDLADLLEPGESVDDLYSGAFEPGN